MACHSPVCSPWKPAIIAGRSHFKSMLDALERTHNDEVQELTSDADRLRSQLLKFSNAWTPKSPPRLSAEVNTPHDVGPPSQPQCHAEPDWSATLQQPNDSDSGASTCFESEFGEHVSKKVYQSQGQGDDFSRYESNASSSAPRTRVSRSSTFEVEERRKSIAYEKGSEVKIARKVKNLFSKTSDMDSPVPSSRRQLFFHRLVKSTQFEIFFAAVTIINSGFLGLRTEYTIMHPDEADPAIIKLCEYLFTALFAFELLLRVSVDGCASFCMPRRLFWYYLDLVVVTSSLFELCSELFSGTDHNEVNMSSSRTIRVIRMIRLIKVLRVARVVRFVRALRTLVLSIVHTMRSVIWSFALLLMIIYVFALVFAQVVHDYLRQEVDAPASLRLFWGTLPRSMFTLYKSIAAGINWHECVTPLADVSGYLVGLFVVYVAFTLFAVLNVVTGVFCEAAIEGARQDYELIVQQHLTQKDNFTTAVCELFGVSAGSEAELSYKEFEDVLTHPNTKAFLAAIQLDVADAWELFKLLDTDESSLIDVTEFVNGCLRLKGGAKAIDLAKLGYEQNIRQKRLVKHMDTVEIALQDILETLPRQHSGAGMCV